MSRSSTAAVVDGELKHVSASQVTTFARCPRKWWFEKVARLPVPTSDAQNIGTKVHGELENYYVNGDLPIHPAAIQALPLLPPRHDQVQSEVSLVDPLLSASSTMFKGFIDLLDFRDSTSIAVVDFKTTKDFKYCKKPDELERNVQMMTYAKWGAERFPEAKSFALSHVYLLTTATTGQLVKPVTTSVTREQAYEYFDDQVVPVVKEMQQAARCSSFTDVRANTLACDDFGGCPFRAQCKQSILDSPRANESDAETKGNSMSLKEKLAEKMKAASTVTEMQPAPEIPTTAPQGIVPPDAPEVDTSIIALGYDSVEVLEAKLKTKKAELRKLFQKMLILVGTTDPDLADAFDDLEFEVSRLERMVSRLTTPAE